VCVCVEYYMVIWERVLCVFSFFFFFFFFLVVPELLLMKDGKVQGKMIGLQDEDKLKHFISKLTEPTIEKK